MTLKYSVFATTLIASVALCANAAFPENNIRLGKPLAGASLRAGDFDMTVYYLDHGDHFEVVATYALHNGPHDPARLRMGLTDGDSVSFGLPGQNGYLYSFARSGKSVAVTAEPSHSIRTGIEQASAD